MTKARDIADSELGSLTVDTDTLVVDETNNRVGVGTSSPDAVLSVGGDVSVLGQIAKLENTSQDTINKHFSIVGDHRETSTYPNDISYITTRSRFGNTFLDLGGTDEAAYSGNSGATFVRFYTAGALGETPSEAAQIDSSGNLLVGTTTPPSDAGAIVANSGIYLGGTGSANKLDDYEEGTWTPTIYVTGTNNVTYQRQQGAYTKIGRLVYVEISLIFTPNSSTGSVSLASLPFSVSADSGNDRGVGSVGYWTGISMEGPLLLTDDGTTRAALRKYDGTDGSNFVQGTDFSASVNIHCGITYKTS